MRRREIVHNKASDLPMLDITAPNFGVEISIRNDKKVIWVNVDGVCVLRICQIPHLETNS